VKRISVILATFNEEKNLEDCLESVRQLADEIIIVDGTSTDKTVSIARKYTDKIFVRKNPLMFHLNKQLAIEKATGEWILYLDADERVTPELRSEILQSTKAQKPKTKDHSGYWIPRKNIIFGKWIKNSFWYPDYQLRLFKRGMAHLPCKSVHEQPELTGSAGFLKNPLIHYNYQTISQFIRKLDTLYTENDARVYLAQKKKVSWLDAIRFPTKEFLATFFSREAYKDGLHGLVLSILQSFSSFVTFAKIWEQQDFPEVQPDDFVARVEKESQRISKEFKYWFLTAKINQTTNLGKKLFLRVSRKVKK